ncbi:MAG: hypothetical protein ACXW3C_15025 [Pyrinomonadaceae bacterium]
MIEKLPNEEFLLDPKPGTAAARARDFGIDMGRLVENLRLSPEERINRLNWMRKMTREVGYESRLDRRTKDLRTLLELEAIYEYKQSLKADNPLREN